MHAFILAGGFATRLWPLTEKRAKPLLPLAGLPLLTHLVEKIPSGMPVTISTNSVFANDFEKWKLQVTSHKSQVDLRPADLPTCDLRILIEDSGHEDQKLGALGAVAKWVEEEDVQEDVLLLAGDNYVGFSLRSFIECFTGKPLIAAFDIRDLAAARKFGTILTEASAGASGTFRVTGFEEKPREPKSALVSTGCSILPEETLAMLVDYSKRHPDNIGGIFEQMLMEGIEIACAPFADPWFDIGSFESYIEATTALVGNRVLTGDGAHISNDIRNPNTGTTTSLLLTQEGGEGGEGGQEDEGDTREVRKTEDVRYIQETTCEGSVVIGKGSKVARSRLRNVVLFENCEVEDCVLENCVIDNDCILRGVDLYGKMLREGTTLVRQNE